MRPWNSSAALSARNAVGGEFQYRLSARVRARGGSTAHARGVPGECTRGLVLPVRPGKNTGRDGRHTGDGYLRSEERPNVADAQRGIFKIKAGPRS